MRYTLSSGSSGSRTYSSGSSTLVEDDYHRPMLNSKPINAPARPHLRSAGGSQATSRHSHSKVTTKFPIPRGFSAKTSILNSSLRGQQQNEDMLPLLLASDEASQAQRVKAKVAELEEADQKAQWTTPKWLLLISVTTVRVSHSYIRQVTDAIASSSPMVRRA